MKKTMASAIIGSGKKWDRKPSDFYPTPPEATVAIARFLNLEKGTPVFDPACGDGALIEVMSLMGMRTRASDIRDTGYGTPFVDFLSSTDKGSDGEWLITNPPFSLAIEFIATAVSNYRNVAMLLKSQFWHASSRLNFFKEHPPSYVLPLTWRPSFLEFERGKNPLMDVLWTVWEGDKKITAYDPIEKPLEVPYAPTNVEILIRSMLIGDKF